MSGVLFDSDFIISLMIDDESTHHQATEIYKNAAISSEHILPFVHYEAITVCSRKYGYDRSVRLHAFIERQLKRVVMPIDEQEVWQEFFLHRKKSISFVDCANLVAARNYGWKIASFDRFYPKSLRLT